MDTIGQIQVAGAVVTGARHLRAGRNGQDAVATWRPEEDSLAAIVVCDGCSAGASSEVGARLGAALMVRALAARLAAGERPSSHDLWTVVRREVVGVLGGLLERLPGERELALRDFFLFTIVAAAVVGDEAAVWVLGDGAYAIDGRSTTIGPFEDNQPPYVGYDLVGQSRPAHFEVANGWSSIVIATDGVTDVGDVARFGEKRFVDHPDALRRQLALLARSGETIDWDEQRVVRTPAQLHDDCAIAVVTRSAR
jgi:hypothetical protein